MTMPAGTEHRPSIACGCPLCEGQPRHDAAADLLPERYQPAGRTDVQNVRNGVYTIYPDLDGDNSGAVSVRVRTVQAGRLEGMRILSRQVEGQWKGFASLQTDGRVWIWRQAEELRGTEYHQLLCLIFRSIANNDRRLVINTMNPVEGRRVAFASPGCAVCNLSLQTMASGCATHDSQFRAAPADSEVAYRNITARGVEQRYYERPAPRVNPFPRTTPQPVPRTPARPRMSEIDPEMVM